MEQLAVYTNASYVEQGATGDFYLDLECNSLGVNDDPTDGNTFAVQLPESIRIAADSALFIDGTPWGGIIQRRVSDTTVDGVLQWEGRTWHGILADRIVEPPAGSAYYTSTGTDTACVTALISKLGLSTLFEAGTGTGAAISYQHPRYKCGWTCLLKMLESVGERPEFRVVRTGGTVKVLIDCVTASTLDELADGELADVEMTAEFRPYNHVIGLGQGELQNRDVVHYYADSSGVISSTKSITGMAERVTVYDNPSAEHDDLVDGAIEHLRDLQGQGEVDVSLDEGANVAIGDYVKAYDQRIDESVTSMVTGCVVKVENGIITCAWSAGE